MVKNVLIGKNVRSAGQRIAAGARFVELEFILNESRRVMVNPGLNRGTMRHAPDAGHSLLRRGPPDRRKARQGDQREASGNGQRHRIGGAFGNERHHQRRH
jgi:hypothetical protein